MRPICPRLRYRHRPIPGTVLRIILVMPLVVSLVFIGNFIFLMITITTFHRQVASSYWSLVLGFLLGCVSFFRHNSRWSWTA